MSLLAEFWKKMTQKKSAGWMWRGWGQTLAGGGWVERSFYVTWRQLEKKKN